MVDIKNFYTSAGILISAHTGFSTAPRPVIAIVSRPERTWGGIRPRTWFFETEEERDFVYQYVIDKMRPYEAWFGRVE